MCLPVGGSGAVEASEEVLAGLEAMGAVRETEAVLEDEGGPAAGVADLATAGVARRA